MSAERWLPVVGYEDRYEVSDLGRVRSTPRTIVEVRGITAKRGGRMMKLKRTERGYMRVGLSLGGKHQRGHFVHCLVAEAFIGPRPEGQEVCHADGDGTNNALSNLRWDTHSNNMLDAVKHGTLWPVRVTHCPRGHALEEPNLVPSRTRIGERTCLACKRASHLVARYGMTFQEASDIRHAEILSAAAGELRCINGHRYDGNNKRPDGRRCRECRYPYRKQSDAPPIDWDQAEAFWASQGKSQLR